MVSIDLAGVPGRRGPPADVGQHLCSSGGGFASRNGQRGEEQSGPWSKNMLVYALS